MRAALLLFLSTAYACPELDEGELRQLVDLELGERAPLLKLKCVDGKTELHLGNVTRSLDLSLTPPSARARLVALAASELSFASRELLREDLPTPRKNLTTISGAAMWKRVLTVSMVVAPVVAASPKPETRIEAHPTALTRIAPPKPSEAPAPVLRAEDVFNKVGAQVQAVTEAQKRLLEKLIATSSGADLADYLVRLGDLYVEEQRYHRFRARSLDHKIFEAKEKDRLKAQQADELKLEEKATLEAVKRYLEVANDHLDYKKMDEVLFDLGRLLREAKKDEAARGFWKRLIKDYPTSKYVPDGLLAFGDDAFQRRDIENALIFYQKVMSYSDNSLSEYARYMSGWCYFNLARFKDALEAFVTVIDHAHRGEKLVGRLALEREAKKDTVRAYAQIGSPDKAWPFFQRVGGESAPMMLEQLAELESSQGKFLDAVRLYRQLIALQPNSQKVCSWQSEIVRNTLAHGGSRAEPESVRELERLTALQAKSKDEECREHASNLLRELATVWHQEAQRTNQISTYELAGALYRQYLRSFPKSADVPQMTFYYAELLYKLERHCDAAPLYMEVVQNQPKHREEAAYAAVLSWQSCLKPDRPVENHRLTGPRPISEPWQKMIASFDFYLKYVPNGPDRVRVQYQKALAYYDFDHCDEAAPLFSDIARKHSDSELAPFAADLLFDCRAQKADKVQLRADVAELCVNPKLTGARPDFARRCRTIDAALIRDQAEAMEAQQRFKEAADQYLKLAQKYSDDPKLDEIIYDAGIDYQKANLIGLSILAFQELMRAKPDSPLAKKSTYMVGRAYQNIAAFDAAAENYEKFAARWGGEKDAPVALSRAAFLRRGLGDTARASEDSKLFLERYGAEHADLAAAVVFGQAQIYEQQRDFAKLSEYLTKYLREYGARGGVDRQIIAHVKLGEIAWRNSCPVVGEGGSCVERRRDKTKAPESCGGPVKLTVHPRRPELVREADAHFVAALQLHKQMKLKDEARAAEADYYAAEARMLEADVEFERFLAIKLPNSQKRLASWFADKTRELDRAREKYESVILMKQAHWAIAAAGRVGQMFQTFAAQLNASPVPPAPPPPRGVNLRTWKEDFRESFCNQLSEHVVALEDKAESALKLCLDKSTSLSWFNEWSSLCEAQLHQLKPRSYSYAAEMRAEPAFVSAPPDRAGLQR
jgi:TolA-binding protein